jgi:hypothetical protein
MKEYQLFTLKKAGFVELGNYVVMSPRLYVLQ